MSPNGHHLAIVETMPQLVGGFPQTMIHVVDLASGKEICKPTITGDVESLAFDQSGRYVAASHYSQPLGTGVVHVWALPNGREVFSSPPALDAHYSNLTFNVIGTQISLNSSRRSSDAPAEHVFVWDLPSGQARLQSPGADVADLYFRSDGHLAVLSTSGEIKMLRVHQSRE